MARASSAAQQRSLTLTEELEKLEQSITLTLQEIDHNFSRAHRIVTSSILPIVEQYATQSKGVWEGSKFWKQFFETSANVSLSGYAEEPSVLETADETGTEDSNATTHTTLEVSEDYETPNAQHISTDSIQDIDLSNLTISPSHSTPRPAVRQKQAQRQSETTFADYPSPYETLRQEIRPGGADNTTFVSTQNGPATPGRRTTAADVAMTPRSSPFLSPGPTSIPRPSTSRKKTDPLLHRVLDRNYRIQATPLTNDRYTLPTPRAGAGQSTAATPVTNRHALHEATLSSSPDVAPPQLHAEIFASPERRTRIPGISVLTPAHNRINRNGAANPGQRPAPPTRTPGVWSSDDEDDDSDADAAFDQSPPKTMQFHIPQSRLLKTPAKEASKRIVQDLLQTAGIGQEGRDDDDDDDEIDLDISLTSDGFDTGPYAAATDENSPSVVRKAVGFEDESF